MQPATKEEMLGLRDGKPFDSYGEKVIPEQTALMITTTKTTKIVTVALAALAVARVSPTRPPT